MEEIKSHKYHINIGSFKINTISLLKQSNLNISLKKLNIPKSKLNLLIKSKNIKNSFNIFFSPIKINSENKENKKKLNPLLIKNKIVKKHNLLQKIDFNLNSLKNNNENSSNKNTELKLHNNNSNFLYYYGYNSNINKNNNNLNSSYNINLDRTTNFQFLAHINNDLNQNSKNKKTNYNLYKHINISPIFNNFTPFDNSSSYNKKLNIFEKYNELFTNDKLKKAYFQSPAKLNQNKTQRLIIHKRNKDINSLNNKKSRNKSNILPNNQTENSKNNNNSEESSSNEDNFDMKEIEKIISKSSYNFGASKNSKYFKNKLLNNSKKKLDVKNYIALNSLYRMKNYSKSNNRSFRWRKTPFINFVKIDISNKQRINDRSGNNYLYKNINVNNAFNKSSTENVNDFHESKIFYDLSKLMPYKYKRKIIKEKSECNLYNSINHSNI